MEKQSSLTGLTPTTPQRDVLKVSKSENIPLIFAFLSALTYQIVISIFVEYIESSIGGKRSADSVETKIPTLRNKVALIQRQGRNGPRFNFDPKPNGYDVKHYCTGP